MREKTIRRNALADDLDPVDARILDILQQDAGLSVAEVADRVGLSASPCWRRIKRMEDMGLIRSRVALVDRRMGHRLQRRKQRADGLVAAAGDFMAGEATGDCADDRAAGAAAPECRR